VTKTERSALRARVLATRCATCDDDGRKTFVDPETGEAIRVACPDCFAVSALSKTDGTAILALLDEVNKLHMISGRLAYAVGRAHSWISRAKQDALAGKILDEMDGALRMAAPDVEAP